ncbi:hypothetical protein PENSTE_c004G04528 [Penicillium steckii]|uniref:Ricin B lectin domain-containing protein n=1 Tax=Penicillium steckii TaxID=303698 RepID=A0A1V6TNK1_9EURO|nr:hypothetical protein PENSTE_c004G04528 [Penicillium steckii]
MKTFFALGALAALCQSALSLKEGTYTIGSEITQGHEILGETEGQGPLSFSPERGNHPGQTWFFTPTQNSQRDFLIHNTFGGYINCGDQEGDECVAGDNKEVYTAELVNPKSKSYELVAKKSGFFLRTNGDSLQIAGFDQSPEERFILTPTQ